MSTVPKDFKVPVGKSIDLKTYATEWFPPWANDQKQKILKQRALALLEDNRQKLVTNQELLWASDTYALLIILQGMDAAGKDSAIRRVMSGVNPQGCVVVSFKTPCEKELDHDFLWHYHNALPERGCIGIFNRSYYEEVLIVKVRPEVLRKQQLPPHDGGDVFWNQRYEDIALFERYLVRNGTVVLKFFLHISKKEQKQRLLKRLKNPDKYWKFSLADLAERSKWPQYQEAYEEMLSKTSTEWAPWYIIPADKKWVAHALISQIIVNQIQKLDLKYPPVSDAQRETLAKAKRTLEKE